jgi:hypothetical protein
VQYVPQQVSWNEWYETPETQLYYYDVPSEEFVQEQEEPSPYVQYFQYSEETQSYGLYEPTAVDE